MVSANSDERYDTLSKRHDTSLTCAGACADSNTRLASGKRAQDLAVLRAARTRQGAEAAAQMECRVLWPNVVLLVVSSSLVEKRPLKHRFVCKISNKISQYIRASARKSEIGWKLLHRHHY